MDQWDDLPPAYILHKRVEEMTRKKWGFERMELITDDERMISALQAGGMM